MPKDKSQIVAEVKVANDIVDVIGGYLELKRSGPRYLALCPFHTEKTPSFTVSQDRQAYHCFGCGKGGDVVNFLMAYEGLTFGEALRKLADRAGIRLPEYNEGGQKNDYLRTNLLEFGKFAARFFRDTLEAPLLGGEGRRYLKTRQLNDETVARFLIGYAPDNWSALLDAARKQGVLQEVIEACGLFKRGDRGSWYDFFRNRLIFPIRDVTGEVVAFGGRDLSGENPAKYINSPETAVYKKSRVLYGLYEARDALRRAGRAILVEGYFDLLRCFDVGIENVLASCGTALTPEQAGLIRRYVGEVVLVYDGDAAGIQAALRATSVLTAAGLTVRALALPDRKDPDDFVRAHGPEAFMDLVERATDFVSFFVAMRREQLETIEGKAQVAQELFGALRGIDSELRRDEYLKRAAQELGLNEWSFKNEFTKFLRSGPPARPVPQRVAEPPRYTRDDVVFLAVLLHSRDYRAQAQAALEARIAPEDGLTEVLVRLFEAGGDGPDFLGAIEGEASRQLYSAAANTDPPQGEAAAELVSKRIIRIERDVLKRESEHIVRELREAERDGDQRRVLELLGARTRLQQQLEKVGAA